MEQTTPLAKFDNRCPFGNPDLEQRSYFITGILNLKKNKERAAKLEYVVTTVTAREDKKCWRSFSEHFKFKISLTGLTPNENL